MSQDQTRAGEVESYTPGEPIVVDGSLGDALFLILSGQVAVHRGQQTFAQALQQEAQAKAAIDAQAPDLQQKYLDSYTTAANDAAAQAEKVREFNVSQGNTAAYRKATLALNTAKVNQAGQKQAWQQTYQSGLLKLKQQGLITDAQYKNASLALRQKAQSSTDAYRQASLALKANGFQDCGVCEDRLLRCSSGRVEDASDPACGERSNEGQPVPESVEVASSEFAGRHC